MEKSIFINEIGNKITVKVKNYNGIEENYKTGDNIKFNGVAVIMIGQTSMSENKITLMEARELYKTLGKFLKNKK